MSNAWGARDSSNGNSSGGGGDRPPFVTPADLQDMKPWQNVYIQSIKRDFTNKDDDEKESRKFYWVMYRHVGDEFVHRQAYWGDKPLYRVLSILGIHEGIDGDEEVRGKELWIKLIIDKPRNSEKEFVKVVAHRAENPRTKIEEVKPIPEDETPF